MCGATFYIKEELFEIWATFEQLIKVFVSNF